MMLTPEEAKRTTCPQSMGTDDGVRPCRAAGCMAWRWEPLNCSPEWVEAVKKAAEEIGDTTGPKAKAARHVNENRSKYGLPDKPFGGWCGLCSKPE